MVNIQLASSGEMLEIQGSLKFTFQNSEIGDISKINSNWSWVFDIPQTPLNVSALNGLGLIGSTSFAPYQSIECSLLHQTDVIVKSAKLKIHSYDRSQKRYKATLSSGIVDFFDLIGDDKLQDVLAVASSDGLRHSKTLTNIVNSWTGSAPYRYIIADYNGKINSDPDYVDFDSTYLVPSANVKWLVGKIFDNYGWTYVGLPDIDKDWMTYDILADDVNVMPVGLMQPDDITFQYGPFFGYDKTEQIDFITLSPQDIDSSYMSNNGNNIVINQTAEYEIQLPTIDWSNMPQVSSIRYEINVNGSPIPSIINNGYYVLGALSAGDTIEVFLKLSSRRSNKTENFERKVNFRGYISLLVDHALSTSTPSPSLNQKVSEFLKEVMMRYAVVAIADPINKEIKFYDIDDRLGFPIEDWTKKRVKRTSETYAYQDYARNNYLRHTYESEEEEYHDGVFRINSENIKEALTVFKSKGFSSNENLVSFDVTNAFPIPAYKKYDIEQTNQGENYKSLKSRFSFLREMTMLQTKPIKVNGNIYNDSYSFAVPRDFDVIANDNYDNINQLLSRVKIVEMDLLLTFFDVKELSFEKRYYFEQEKAYFLLNKLTWDSARKIHKGEFLKITTDQ